MKDGAPYLGYANMIGVGMSRLFVLFILLACLLQRDIFLQLLKMIPLPLDSVPIWQILFSGK